MILKIFKIHMQQFVVQEEFLDMLMHQVYFKK